METGFWLWVSRVGAVISCLAFSGVAAATAQWWAKVGRYERRRQRAAELAAGRTHKPVALAIRFEGASIESDVVTYLSESYTGWSFPSLPLGGSDPDPSPCRWPVLEFEHGGTLTWAVAHADLERLRQVERWLKEEGYDEVHLFMRSTVAFGCAVGSLFTNWGGVHVYHWGAGAYEHWFSLDEVKHAAPAPTLGDAVAEWAGQRLYARRETRHAVDATSQGSGDE
jgi:hypothetical protein